MEEKPKKKSTARARLHRQKMKADGFRAYISITPEHKALLKEMCRNTKISQANLISYENNGT